MDMEHKSVEAELKALDDKGEGVLRFIRFHQEDKDLDITYPGFIQNQKAVLLASHNWKSDFPPLGYGESFEADGATNFRFRLNLQDDRAKAWHSWLKMDKDGLQQVSYGFSPYPDAVERWSKDGRSGRYLKPRADGSPGAKLHECSFVVVGSGNDTAVLSVKAFDDLPEPEMVLGDWDDLKAAGVRIQSLIFPKDKWDSTDAVRSWLRSHDYSAELDSTGSSWRARQEEPGRFQRLRSFCINPGRSASASECRVMAVGGPLKESRGMEQEHPVIELAPGRWAVGVHRTEVDAKSWDTSIQVHRIHATGAPGYYRQIYAAQNPHADLTSKSSFAFPHHFIGADGEPGAASVRACAEGLVILQRYWNGLVPDEELKGIHAHLSAHLKDAGREPPELRSAGDVRYPLDDQIELVLWGLEDVLHQIDHVRDMRSRKGMALTEPRLGQIEKLDQFFTTMRAMLKMKRLDRPSDLVLEELSAEARADALGRRLEDMRAKTEKQIKDTEAAEIALRVQRWQHRLRG
jgi:hypothetical protein